jgi:arabinogalactan endo-1,4-beta-galactosidase
MRLPTLSLLSLFASTTLAALPFRGVDWSSLLVTEAVGTKYKNTAGTVQPLETILKSSGVNIVRQRIWVNPSDGNYGLDYNIKLAKRAKAAGLQVYLDFHYSDTWADPAHQVLPAAWKSLAKDALVKQIYDYTKNVLDMFQKNGLSLAIVSIGNEITPGLLFPIGQLSKTDGPKNAAALLKSASKAVKESSLAQKPKIMIHLDNGWNWSTQQWWYDTVLGSGGGLTAADYDIQGVSCTCFLSHVYATYFSTSVVLSTPDISITGFPSSPLCLS